MEKEKSNILQKLSNVQMELKAPKDQKNSFGNYKYRSCEDILEAVKPLLKKNDLTLVISDTLENIGDRYYVKATATIYDIESGTTLSNTAYAREEETKKGMDGSQITGTSSSYARKYALNGLFNIDDTKDADTDEYTKKTKEEPKENTKNHVSLLKEYEEYLLKSDTNRDDLYEYFKVKDYTELTDTQLTEAIKIMAIKISKKEITE